MRISALYPLQILREFVWTAEDYWDKQAVVDWITRWTFAECYYRSNGTLSLTRHINAEFMCPLHEAFWW